MALRLSPESPRGHLGAGRRRLLRAAFALASVILVAAAVNALLGVGGAAFDEIMRTWASSALYVIVAGIVALRAISIRESRAGWILLAVGLVLYCAGNLLWTLWLEGMESAPIPSASDVLWLSLYPACYAGLVLLARRGRTRTPAGVWLDGIVAGLGIAALGAAIVVRPVLDSASGDTAAVVTNLAYPVADLLLAALVTGILALRGWRLDARWAALGGGFLILCVADTLYLLQVATGDHAAGLLPNLFYLSGVVLLAHAAWLPARTEPPDRLDGWSILLVPAAFALTAVALLVHDHFSRLDPLAFALATLTIVAVVLRTVLSFRDLRTLAQTRREAATDELTDLPNRRHFLRAVDQRIAASRGSGEEVALLIIDLDQFKELNDALGHHAGDELLRQLGPRLKGFVRSTDLLARLGGDEFGLLLGAPSGEDAATQAAARVGDALRQPFEVQGLRMKVGASIGIAHFPRDAEDGEQLLQYADTAMYRAKAAGSAWEVYAREGDLHPRDGLELASEIADAIATDQLELRFQPLAAIDGRVVAVEALVRWAHPRRGLIAPNVFIPVVEQAGLMRDLTRWVMDAAMSRWRSWNAQGYDLDLALNVSVPDLLDVAFPDEVAQALLRHGMDPAKLVLEVTETSIMSDRVRITDVLGRLGELGVALSLDDFGTGYSSLVHLKTLPVSELKIDRGFVMAMGEDSADREIVRATIQLAHNLGMTAVAEGVESAATWEALAALGCDYIQGYHLARPLDFDQLEVFLAGYTNLLKRAL